MGLYGAVRAVKRWYWRRAMRWARKRRPAVYAALSHAYGGTLPESAVMFEPLTMSMGLIFVPEDFPVSDEKLIKLNGGRSTVIRYQKENRS